MRNTRKFHSAGSIIRTSVHFFTGVLLLGACNQSASNNMVTPSAVNNSLVDIFESHTLLITAGEWAPYTGKDLDHYGCDIWITTEAFETQGFDVEYEFFPWARSYLLAKTGESDGTIEWDDTPEQRQDFYFSSEYLSEQEWVFFYRSDTSFDWNTLEDLEGLVIGTTSGYIYSDAFSEFLEKGTITFEEASSDEANMRKLLQGRIDVFPIERMVGESILQKFSPEEREHIRVHPRSLHAFHPYLLLSKAIPENEQRIQAFDRGFQFLKEQGRYDEIMQICLPHN